MRSGGSAASRASISRTPSRRWSSGATATSSRRLFGRRDDGEPVLGFHALPALGPADPRRRRPQARLRGQQRGAQRGPRLARYGSDLPAYDPRSHVGVLRNLVVREGRRTGQLQTRPSPSAAEIPRPPVDLHTLAEGPSGTDGETGVLGREYLDEEIGGLRLRISPAAFFQTNTEMAERLIAIAADYAQLGGGERLYDLYCGSGRSGWRWRVAR